jgi:hypothetical protein
MKFGLPPWLKRATDTVTTALVKYEPVVDLSAAEEANGWTPEALAKYHAESHDRAMAVVAASMEAKRRGPRPRWANSQYSPLRWRG